MTIDRVDATIFARMLGATFHLSPITQTSGIVTLRTFVYVALLAMVLRPQVAQATPAGAIWVSGAEIQDYRFEASDAANAGFNTTIPHSGNAAFVVHSGGGVGQGRFQTPTWGSAVTSGTVYVSAWVYISSNPCPLGCNAAFMIAGSTIISMFKFDSATSSVTFVRGINNQIGGAYTITTNAWHLFEMKISIDGDTAANDVLEARIDGAVRSNQTTSSVDTGTAPVDLLRFLSPNISTHIGGDLLVDDIIVTSDDYVGMDGHVVMRTANGTGFYGAGPLVVAFTGCSSYATCWGQVPPDDTPFPTTYANDGTGNFPRFLATIGDFSTGPDAVASVDTVFGCRGTWSIAKGPSGSNRNWQMLRRIDQTAVETNIPSTGALDLSTTFSRWDDLECTMTNCGPWGSCPSPPCTGAIDSVELGGFRNNPAQAKVERVGGVYVSCAYRRNPTILIKTLSGTLDLSWKSDNHNQTIVESLAKPVGIFDCVGTSPTTCDLFALATGKVQSVSPSISGGVPACIVTTATGDFTGTITYTGSVSSVDSLDVSLPQKIGIYAGLVPPSAPCPTCSGANLGDSGTCQGGANNGQPCVVDGTYGSLGNTSASCSPSTTLYATMFPDVSSSSTGIQTLPATHTCTGVGAIGLCHCTGQQYANECSDQICDPDETCAALGPPFCFPNPIVRAGSTSPLTVGGVGCIPATQTFIDGLVGLPGPIAISLDLEITP